MLCYLLTYLHHIKSNGINFPERNGILVDSIIINVWTSLSLWMLIIYRKLGAIFLLATKICAFPVYINLNGEMFVIKWNEMNNHRSDACLPTAINKTSNTVVTFPSIISISCHQAVDCLQEVGYNLSSSKNFFSQMPMLSRSILWDGYFNEPHLRINKSWNLLSNLLSPFCKSNNNSVSEQWQLNSFSH